MITQDQLLNRILWLGMEDYAGLWEVVWELNGLLPDRSSPENQRLAYSIIRYLFEKKFIEFYRCKGPDGELKAVPPAFVSTVLANPASWEPPDFHGTSWRISTTESGVEKYHVLPTIEAS